MKASENGEAGVQRLMTLYCSYDERSRTHLSLDKDTPIPRTVTPPGHGVVVAIRRSVALISTRRDDLRYDISVTTSTTI